MLTSQAPQDPVAAITAAIPIAEKDGDRPTFHFHPPAQWMNDPNGPIYYRGWYHLFYQHNPYGDQWGHMHWGHARSRDMVDWEQLRPAVAPAKDRGEDHVYSGSTHLNGYGKPVIFYTSISDKRPPEQWVATPLDDELIKWVQPANDPVLTLKAHGDTKIDEWRDPFIFDNDGATYMVTGGNIGGKGTVALYKASDKELMDWKYVGILFHHPTANDVECPNFVKIGNKWVLLVSVFGHVEWFSGSLADHKFVSEKTGILADGSYASQILKDKTGKPIHLAWINTGNHVGWNGVMTLPSELSLSKDGVLFRKPIAALSNLRINKISDWNGMELAKEPYSISGGALEFTVNIESQGPGLIKVAFPGGQLTYDSSSHLLTIPQRGSIVLKPSPSLRIHGFLDHAVLDVYVNDGEVTFSSLVDTRKPSLNIEFSVEGGNAKFKDVAFYRLRGARFDMSQFGP